MLPSLNLKAEDVHLVVIVLSNANARFLEETPATTENEIWTARRHCLASIPGAHGMVDGTKKTYRQRPRCNNHRTLEYLFSRTKCPGSSWSYIAQRLVTTESTRKLTTVMSREGKQIWCSLWFSPPAVKATACISFPEPKVFSKSLDYSNTSKDQTTCKSD